MQCLYWLVCTVSTGCYALLVLVAFVLGTNGEGWFDPWQLVHSLKAKNMHLGVNYCEGEVSNIRRRNYRGVDGEMHSKIIGVDVSAMSYVEQLV